MPARRDRINVPVRKLGFSFTEEQFEQLEAARKRLSDQTGAVLTMTDAIHMCVKADNDRARMERAMTDEMRRGN